MRFMLTLLMLAIVAIGIAVATAHAQRGSNCSTTCYRNWDGSSRCNTQCN